MKRLFSFFFKKTDLKRRNNSVFKFVDFFYDKKILIELETKGFTVIDCLESKKLQILQKNDVVICMANGSKQLVGKAALFTVNDNFKYTFGAFMGCFRVYSTDANPAYVFYNFLSNTSRNFIEILLSGSSINSLKMFMILLISLATN
jgi:hypothetical protein